MKVKYQVCSLNFFRRKKKKKKKRTIMDTLFRWAQLSILVMLCQKQVSQLIRLK